MQMRELGTSYELATKQLESNHELIVSSPQLKTPGKLTARSSQTIHKLISVVSLLQSIHLHNGSCKVIAQK